MHYFVLYFIVCIHYVVFVVQTFYVLVPSTLSSSVVAVVSSTSSSSSLSHQNQSDKGSSDGEKAPAAGDSDDENCDNDLSLPLTKDRSGSSISSGSERDRDRNTECRQYIKELLIRHPLWLLPRFWEQALWQCVTEQLQLAQVECDWPDMEREERSQCVLRVHEVVFSQVMAISHSMTELGCNKDSVRKFIYRMCVSHQLSEGQRHDILSHLNRSVDA